MKLFIHGVPDTGHMWAPLIEALGLTPDQYRAPTLPGFDGTLPEGFAATAGAYRGWVMAQLTELAKAHGPVDLVGHDWGAAFASASALALPETIRSWTIINAVPEPSYHWHDVAQIWQTPDEGEALMAKADTDWFYALLTKAGMPAPLASVEAAQVSDATRQAILTLYRSAINPSDWAGLDFGQIAHKGQILWGQDDPFVPERYARTFSERWSIPLRSVPQQGHWGLCASPAPFAEHLKAHWAGFD